MANLVIPAAGVKPSSKAVRKEGTAGTTIVQGNVLALDPVSNKLVLADSNSATEEIREVKGIAINGASDGQPVKYVESDPALEIGAGLLTVGKMYILSSTPGMIAEEGDDVTGDYVSSLGVAISTHELNMNVTAAGAPTV